MKHILIRIAAAAAVSLTVLTAGCSGKSGNGNKTGKTENSGENIDESSGENSGENIGESSASPAGYTQISQDEAKEMMLREDGHIVLDVRTRAEYDEGHIPGAVCLPNEEIGTAAPEELPDHDAVLLVYCRSGRRSKEAAEKLAAMGYTRVYEFGGIITWTGSIETTENTKAGNAVTGETAARQLLVIEAGGRRFEAEFEDNSSAEALIGLLREGPLELEMRDYGGFEKVADLPRQLPANDSRITTRPGDIILYQGSQITVYYAENTWSFTRLAHIAGATQQELKEALGGGSVRVIFSLSADEGQEG